MLVGGMVDKLPELCVADFISPVQALSDDCQAEKGPRFCSSWHAHHYQSCHFDGEMRAEFWSSLFILIVFKMSTELIIIKVGEQDVHVAQGLENIVKFCNDIK